MKRYIIIASLIFVLILSALGVYFIYQAKFKVSYDTLDPDTGQIITVNGVTSGEKASEFSLYGSSLLIDKGMGSHQSKKVVSLLKTTVIDTYKNTYKQVAINAKSLTYTKNTRVYSFKVRLGEVDSKKYIFVTITDIDMSHFSLKIDDDTSKTIKNEPSVDM